MPKRTSSRPKRGLTERQKRFVKEYVACGNGAEAARRAGYSAKTADRIAHENLRKPEIAEAIAKAGEKASERAELTQEWVLRRLMEEASQEIDNPLSVIGAASSRVAALNILSKCLGLQITKTENKHEHHVNYADGAREKLFGAASRFAQSGADKRADLRVH